MAPRALRVGVLINDNLVEERVFRAGEVVTFGQSLRCALSVPGDRVPREHVLFAIDGGRRVLRPAPGMTGRVAIGDAVKTELPAELALEAGARGKLVLGEVTVLFQDVAAVAMSPRPVLPASVRGTVWDRIDKRLAVIVGASVAAHLGIAIYAWATDIDERSMFETPVAQQYKQDVIEVTIPDEPAPLQTAQEPDPGPGAATPVSPRQTPRPIVPRTTNPAAPPQISEADALRFAQVLTGPETGPGATAAGDLAKRQPGADLGSQIDAVGRNRVAIGNENNGGFRQQRDGIDPTERRIANDPTQQTELPKGPEREPRGRIVIKKLPGEGSGTTLTVDMVLDKINGLYQPGLQRCYKKGLLGDAKLGGSVHLAFTVTERGTLEDATASGVSSEVDACISAAMAGWRFAIPKDKDGDPTDQDFKLVLALSPG